MERRRIPGCTKDFSTGCRFQLRTHAGWSVSGRLFCVGHFLSLVPLIFDPFTDPRNALYLRDIHVISNRNAVINRLKFSSKSRTASRFSCVNLEHSPGERYRDDAARRLRLALWEIDYERRKYLIGIGERIYELQSDASFGNNSGLKV